MEREKLFADAVKFAKEMGIWDQIKWDPNQHPEDHKYSEGSPEYKASIVFTVSENIQEVLTVDAYCFDEDLWQQKFPKGITAEMFRKMADWHLSGADEYCVSIRKGE